MHVWETGVPTIWVSHIRCALSALPWVSTIQVRLDELHVILDCPGSCHARRAAVIYTFVEARLPVMTEQVIMKEFLGVGTGRTLIK